MERGPPGLHRWLNIDPYLIRYRPQLIERFLRFNTFRKKLTPNNDLDHVTKAYEYYGIHINRSTGVVIVREWAPGAAELFFAGDFNYWNRSSHPFTKINDDTWELYMEPTSHGRCVLQHLSEVKIIVKTHDGRILDRLSPWATYVVEPLLPSDTQYRQKVWFPPIEKVYKFLFPKPSRPRGLKIYECHIGIATGCIDAGIEVGTYRKFTSDIIPRIKANGYNAIQLMAIMEHAYYASFGYQVTSFYAVSSRYGTPEELKILIDKAHSLGLYVILDIVHSHASQNVDDGLNEFDGTKGCFFYDDSRGYHSLWGSRMFNTNKMMVLRFLISNACWFVDEYNFDGFRFDGITAMMYKSRGIDHCFSGTYDDYFGDGVDPNGALYCQLMNYFLHRKYKNMITIAEEVSGVPGTCRPCYEGGLGFDYRLAMAIPDKWIQYLKNKQDEEWDMSDLVWTHANRRHKEPHVAYCESHDQALVGDKTIAFWLMDAKMYTSMQRKVVQNVIIDRGIALHKVIRLFTHALGGEAYMNFIGNEFGHPEWLDFPRDGNAWSYHYCRRQWKLVDNERLLYTNLNEFDKAMNTAEEKYHWLSAHEAYVSLKHENDKIVVFERAGLVFIFNFHVAKSFSDYMIGVDMPGEYECILSTDEPAFAGHNRVDTAIHYLASNIPYSNRNCSMRVYIPNRAAIVLALSSEVETKEKQYVDVICKTVADITNYALEKSKEKRHLEMNGNIKSVELVGKSGVTTIPELPQIVEVPCASSTANPIAEVNGAASANDLGTAMIVNMSDYPTALGTSAGSSRSTHSLVQVVRVEPNQEAPPMGERFGGGETPPTAEARVLFMVAKGEHSGSSDGGSGDGPDVQKPDESLEVNPESPRTVESSDSGGSPSKSAQAQFGSGTKTGSAGSDGLKSHSGSSLGSETGRNTAKDLEAVESDPSTSTYETASSSRLETARSVSDIFPDLSIWTTSTSCEDLKAAIERFQVAVQEEPEEFLDAFEDIPDDDDEADTAHE